METRNFSLPLTYFDVFLFHFVAISLVAMKMFGEFYGFKKIWIMDLSRTFQIFVTDVFQCMYFYTYCSMLFLNILKEASIEKFLC